MTVSDARPHRSADDEQLAALGYTGVFLDAWIVAIGIAVVAGSGLLYLLIARPDRTNAAPREEIR